LAFAQAQFDRYQGFYQGDAVHTQPNFAAPHAQQTGAAA
jgi:hypothetical protein